MGAARPPPIPGVEPADNGGSSGAEVSVEPVSVREHTSNSPPKHSPQTRRRKDGGFLWFFLPLLCLMSLLFLLLKYQAKPVPIVVPPRTVPSAQPTNSTASPRGSITPTPAPTTVANNPPSASLPPPNQPEDLFLMFKVGTMVSVAGTREGVHARMRVPQRHVFKKQKLPDGSVGSITFESDAADPALLTRLLKRYNEDFQTDITVDDGRISTIRYSVPLEKPTRYRDVQGPSFKEGWRTKVPRFSPVVFAPNQQPYWRLETSEGVITVKLMHQIVMVQGGCPFGRGSGGPGYEFAGEFDPNVKHDRAGLLSMANRGPGTDGAQFFLTFAPARYLDGKHTIFGEIAGQSQRGDLEADHDHQGHGRVGTLAGCGFTFITKRRRGRCPMRFCAPYWLRALWHPRC